MNCEIDTVHRIHNNSSFIKKVNNEGKGKGIALLGIKDVAMFVLFIFTCEPFSTRGTLMWLFSRVNTAMGVKRAGC